MTIQSLAAVLEQMESAQDRIAAAVDAEDWGAVQGCNDSMNSSLMRFDGLLAGIPDSVADDLLAGFAERLGDMLQRHNDTCFLLAGLRERTAAEHRSLQRGHQAASAYLDIAGQIS